MSTESSRDIVSDSMKERIADQIYRDISEKSSPTRALFAMIREGFEGVNNMDDRELFRRAMMYGFLDEDAGRER